MAGYASVDPAPYINFGSADGCPENNYSNTVLWGNSWEQSDYYYVSWGAMPANALPDIYKNSNPDMPAQWEMIDFEGVDTEHNAQGKILFKGPLGDYKLDPTNSQTSDQAWTYSWDAINTTNHSEIYKNFQYSAEMNKTN